jgi:peptidoglycan/LPS O-acetylase OafA/YrhL
MSGARHRPDAEPATPPSFITSLHGLRGVLSVGVVLVHVAPLASALVPSTTPAWNWWVREGYVVLDMFFILSGFVITSGYGRTFAVGVRLGTYGRFLWSRLARFYPTYLAVLTLLVIAVGFASLSGIHLGQTGSIGTDLAKNVVLIQGWGFSAHLSWNGPTWSVSSEWFCYLLFPLAAPLLARVTRPPMVAMGYAVAVATPLVAYSFLGFDDGHLTYIAPLWRAVGEFVAGSLLCQLNRSDSRLPGICGRSAGVLAVASATVLAALTVWHVPAMFVTPMLGLLVLGLAQQKGALATVLSSRPFTALANVSVTLFLVHVPTLMLAAKWITPTRFNGELAWLGIGLSLLATFIAAVIAHIVVEKPSQRAMKAIAGRNKRSPMVKSTA